MKSVLRAVLIFFVVAMFVVSTEVAHGITFSTNAVSNVDAAFRLADAPAAPSRVFLNQTFDNETIGPVPINWTMQYPQYGNITVVNTTWYGSRPAGRCAMITDSHTDSNPLCYRFFPQQIDTIAISFAIKPTNTIGVKKTIEVYIDDGNFNGACIVFEDGKIGYRTEPSSFSVLRSSYVPDRWYKIDLLLKIRSNHYRIFIDDHLETGSTDLDFIGTCTQIHRIAFNETSGEDAKNLAVAYIDEILGLLGIEVPGDYPTIQEGIDAAHEGDLVVIAKQRTYFESILIPSDKSDIWLCGEELGTTIVDGGFAAPWSTADGILVRANYVKISTLTIRSTRFGAGIHVESSYNIIDNCNVTNGMGNGIYLAGPNNTVSGTTVRSNLKCGILIDGSNCTLTGNVIETNDENGISLSGSNSTAEDNIIGSSFGCGMLIHEGMKNLVRNNTLKKNGVGLKCDTNAKNNSIYQNRFINNTIQAYNLDDTNEWDDGYPYAPDNETGGGNYWSDFLGVDVYSGENQDQHSDCCLPDEDGICDEPYNLSPVGQDRYPLFLIQNVSPRRPDPDYDDAVNVTATLLKFVDIERGLLKVQYDSTGMNISMRIVGNNLTGTIPPLKYGTQVRYNVTVHADSAEVWVSSINYPPEGSYRVDDRKAPNILNVSWSPIRPDVKEVVNVTARVNDRSVNASGVDKVYLTYLFHDTLWTAVMTFIGNETYSAVIPQQVEDGRLDFNVSAVDKAGRSTPPTRNSTQINTLPELIVSYRNVVYQEPCNVDVGVMYRGEKRQDLNLRFNNTGQEPMSWRIDLVKDGSWVKISPLNGTIAPGNSTVMNVTLDTAGLDPNLYAAEFAVTTNGSVLRYVLVIRVTVRHIVIDESYASLEAPERCNVNETQHYGFHAIWAHNSTDAVSGEIKVGGKWREVNATGWANFDDNSTLPAQRTYYVEDVNFTYTKEGQVYLVRSFTQKALNRTTIWDRVKIVLAFLDDRIDINSQAVMLTNSSTYEFDDSPFNGAAYLNDTLVKNNVDKYYFTTSNIMDNKYGLTAFNSNTVSCIWDRIKIIGGGRSKEQTAVGTTEKIWLIGIYEYDNALLKGANGTLFLNVYEYDAGTRSWRLVMSDEAMDWSAQNDRWEKSYSFSSQGTRRFNVSRVEDRLHNLTTIKDLVGPLDMTWLSLGWSFWRSTSDNSSGNSQPVPAQDSFGMPLWAIASIAVTLAIGMSLIILILVRSGKPQIRKRAYNHTEGRYEE